MKKLMFVVMILFSVNVFANNSSEQCVQAGQLADDVAVNLYEHNLTDEEIIVLAKKAYGNSHKIEGLVEQYVMMLEMGADKSNFGYEITMQCLAKVN